MKVSYELLCSPVEIKSGQLCCITIENTIEFRNVLESFISSSDRIGFYENEQQLKQRNILFIDNILAVDLNERKLMTSLYKTLEEMMLEEDLLLKTNEINSKISEYLEDLIFESDLPLMIQEDFDRQGLLKSMGLRVVDESESFVEKIMDYLDLVLRFVDYKVIVFANLMVFLNEAEVRELIRFANRNEIILMTIERIRSEGAFIGEKIDILFDNDLCRVL